MTDDWMDREIKKLKDMPVRDPGRITPLLSELAVYWTRHPDLRLGQLLANFGIGYNGSDERLMGILRKANAEDA